MKSIFKYFMLVAVAAMSLVSCEQASDEISIPEIQEVVMTINAGVDETRTYIDETDKIVKWSEGDNLKVIENSKTYRTTTKIDIDADGLAKFTVSFPANNTDSEFTYNAIFPADAVTEDDSDKINVAKVKVTVKDQQMPTATSFDPEADVLVAKQIVADAQPTELNMQFKRLVALGKMTLKNFPDANAEITKVVFTAGEKDVLAGRNYVNATTGEIAEYGYYGKTNTITLNYIEPITTRNIYFTCNPFEMEAGETFTVKAYCKDYIYTREVTIPDGRSLVFTAGNLGTFLVDMKDATKETNTAFAEGKYMVIAKSDNKYYAMKGVNGSGDYMTYAEVTYDGEATTISTSDETLVWDITAVDGGFTFQNNAGKYLYGSSSGNKAYLGDAQTLTISPIDKTNQYKIAILEISERILAFNANSGQERFAFYKGTQVNNLYLVPVSESTSLSFEVSPEELLFDSNGDSLGDDFFKVTSSVDGFDAADVTTKTEANWIEIEQDGAEFTILVEANSGAKRTANIVFSAEGYSDVTVKVSQEGDTTTEPEVLAELNKDANYIFQPVTEMKGGKWYAIVSDNHAATALSSNYGYLQITDGSARNNGIVLPASCAFGFLTVDGGFTIQQYDNKYVYQTGTYNSFNVAATMPDNGAVWSVTVDNTEFTIKNNSVSKFVQYDTQYKSYGSYADKRGNIPTLYELVEIDNTPVIVSVSAGSLSFAAEGESKEFTVTTLGSATLNVTDDAEWLETSVTGNKVSVVAVANTLTTERNATITITYGEDSKSVAVYQAAPAGDGEIAGGSDDFKTVNANSSYTTRETTNGWVGTNCAVMQGGTSDNNPTFKFIGGENSIRAFTMNGKTSAKGTITSPTLTTGCGTLSLNYGHAFSESNGVDFTITIKQNGTTVQTYKVDVNSITQKKAYTWEQEVNVAGDFVIEITNNCPSNNSSSNKDRVSIWNIVWTGYGN